MRTKEVLEKVGTPRDKLYYLENKEFIKPKKISRGEIEVREYSEEDLEKIRAIWKYQKQGFKLSVAYEKAVQELKSPD